MSAAIARHWNSVGRYVRNTFTHELCKKQLRYALSARRQFATRSAQAIPPQVTIGPCMQNIFKHKLRTSDNHVTRSAEEDNSLRAQRMTFRTRSNRSKRS
eukprot:12426809-Karenia_brevis.AAC.1